MRRARFAIYGGTIVLNFALSIAFAWRFAELPWPVGQLAIDGESYLKGAQEMVANGSWWLPIDTYHSPGFQSFLAALLRLVGAGGLVYASKILSLGFFAGSLWLVYRLGQRILSAEAGACAAALFSFSLSWRFYSSMIQYEVLAGFLLLAWVCLELLPRRRTVALEVLGGVLLYLLAWIQVRYVIFFILPPLLFRERLRGWISVTTAASLTAATVAAESFRSGALVPLMTGGAFRFKLANNPGALGEAFPYPPILEPSGLGFIIHMPGRFLWLLGQRFLYLWGFLRDIWSLPPPELGQVGSWVWLDSVSLLFLIAGVALAGARAKLPALVVLAIALPTLAFFASKRFLIPAMPEIALFQAYALLELGQELFRWRVIKIRGLAFFNPERRRS